MKNITTPIIPVQAQFAKTNQLKSIDYQAICLFAATGFFWDTDTYWKYGKKFKN